MKSKKAMVIGKMVNKSLSPLIFNYWFSKYSISGEYKYKKIKKEEFKKQLNKILKNNDLCGINITIPFKTNIIPFTNSLDRESKKIGAVNCITIKKNKLHGSNTDWIGFTKSLKNKTSKKDRVKKTAIIIGYGGAAKATLYALLKLEYKKIHVFNRTFETIKKINHKRVETHPMHEINSYINISSLIINTIPTNILKKHKVTTTLSKNCIVFDVVYNPIETKFLNHFKNPKKKIYGTSMLVNQAIPCFKKWYGITPIADEKLFKTIKKELTK